MDSIALLNKLIAGNNELIDYVTSSNKSLPGFNEGALAVLKARKTTYQNLLIEELNNKLENNNK